MRRFTISICQSVHTLALGFDLIEDSAFVKRSVRLAPLASSLRADVYLSLAAGSTHEHDFLLGKLRNMSAVNATHPSMHLIWPGSHSVPADAGGE